MTIAQRTRETSFGRTLLIALGLSTASVIMLWLSLPGYEQWYLSFVSMVPMLVVLQSDHGKTAVLLTWATAFAFYVIAASWLSHLTPMGWWSLAFYLSLAPLLFALLMRMLPKGTPSLPFVVAVPVFWVALQLLRGLPVGGFSWFLLGHNLYRQLRLIQIADLVGVYGISFVVVAVNAAIARIVHLAASGLIGERLFRREAVIGAVCAGVLVLATLTYGTIRLMTTDLKPGPTVSVVQGDIPQDLKEVAMAAAGETTDAESVDMWEVYRTLTETLPKHADELVVWPETIAPPLEGAVCSKEAREKAFALRRRLGRPFMVGAIRLAGVDNAVQRTNCAFYFPEDNRYEYAAKIYPVPFGEEIPFKQIGWFHDLVEFYMPEGYEARLTAGEDVIKVFRLKTWTFAADICYEDTQASLNRRFRKAGAQFVVNLTNDGWFGETVELDQHLANSVFRTVENRFAMVRATNTGISAFVDPTGRIVAHIVDESGKYRRVAGTLTHRLMLDERRTVYTVVGDLFAWLTLGTAGALVLVRVVRRCMRMVRRS